MFFLNKKQGKREEEDVVSYIGCDLHYEHHYLPQILLFYLGSLN